MLDQRKKRLLQGYRTKESDYADRRREDASSDRYLGNGDAEETGKDIKAADNIAN